MLILLSVFPIGWVAAVVIGRQAYFLGQSKPIHARNWRSDSFEQLAQSVTNQETFSNRVPAFTDP